MNLRWIPPFLTASAATLLYGALVEANRLVSRKLIIPLPDWPKSLDGYQIGIFADLHLRTTQEKRLTQGSINWLKEQDPDIVLILGDFVSFWQPPSQKKIIDALQGIQHFSGRTLAINGNHDHFNGDPKILLQPILEDFGINLLQNQRHVQDGIQWIGVDSGNEGKSDPYKPLLEVDHSGPVVTLWHEPDLVDHLPPSVDLMLSGHSHGGQFVTPWGKPFMTSRNGTKYLRGYYPHANVPLFVSPGLATTGPPSRLFCPPEVTLLTIVRA